VSLRAADARGLSRRKEHSIPHRVEDVRFVRRIRRRYRPDWLAWSEIAEVLEEPVS